MNTLRLVTAFGILTAVVLLVAPSAGLLLSGPPVPPEETIARAAALLIVAASYAISLGMLVLLTLRLLQRQSKPAAWALSVVASLIGGLLTPFAALPAVLGVRSLCHYTLACGSEVLQFVPHALLIGSAFPESQVLPSIVALFILFTIARHLQGKHYAS